MADQGVDESYYEAYRKNMQIVYMPQKADMLQTRLKDSSNYWLTYMIYQYKKHEVGMKAYLKKIDQDPEAYFRVCYQYAYSALPKSAHGKLPGQAFSIIPLHNDVHVEDHWVVFTLLCAYFYDTNQLGALGGHEMHHALRPAPKFKPQPKDETVVTVLYKILNEGSADMVDKKYTTDTARVLLPYQRLTGEFYDEGKAVLPHLDSLLQIKAQKDTLFKVRDYLRGASNTSGHIPGTYISSVIEKNGLKSKLLMHIDDPFYFFLVYNQAALKDKSRPFVFSKASIEYITSLRKRYMQL